MTRRPTGRPPIGPEKSVRLPAALWARVEVDAASSGITRVAMIRRIVEFYYDARDGLGRRATSPTHTDPEDGIRNEDR